MTKHGEKISETDTDEIRERLAEQPDDGQAVMRLVAAREYKAGLSPAQIEEKYGWPEGTVYHWLDYIEERDVDDALTDKERSGRPSELSDDQWEQLEEVLEDSPQEVGYDAQIWSPRLVRHYIETTFGVEYSLSHLRRVMRRMGLSYRSLRPQHHEADPEEQEEWQEDFEDEWSELDDDGFTVVAMDQLRQTMRTVRRRGWVQAGSEPRIEISYPQQEDEFEMVLGAVTEDGDCLFCRTEEYLNRNHAIHFLRFLEQEIGGKIAVLADQASYFTANDVKDFVKDRALKLYHFPSKSPELNPMEGGWSQFKDTLANRVFTDFDELHQAVTDGLDSINPPDIRPYVCP